MRELQNAAHDHNVEAVIACFADDIIVRRALVTANHPAADASWGLRAR